MDSLGSRPCQERIWRDDRRRVGKGAMNRTMRWGLIGLAAFIGFLILTLILVNRGIEERLNRVYTIPVTPFPIPDQARAVDRGRHLVEAVFFCSECHGEDLGGKPHFDDPLSGQISAKNLTSGEGGLPSDFQVDDWIRAVRHGVGQNGKPLVEMPANAYQGVSDSDLGAIIAYVRGLPPVDNTSPPVVVGPLYRLSILSDPSLLPAEVIDHDREAPASVKAEASPAYGAYLAAVCTICHGEDLAGGPGAGAGLNLTPGGDLSQWSQAEFMRTLRSGVTPKEVELDRTLMPIDRVRNMTDMELEAIWLYLQSIPAREGEAQ